MAMEIIFHWIAIGWIKWETRMNDKHKKYTNDPEPINIPTPYWLFYTYLGISTFHECRASKQTKKLIYNRIPNE